MKAVVDRIVQYANRYQLTNTETGEVLGTFDFDEVTGTVQQVGTEIDKELFDSIANDLAARVVSNGGELANTIVTFSDISGTAANVASGEKSSTLWGKVKNWFSRLKALAFKDKISNADVADNAAIAQSKISGLESALAGKQQAITGAASTIASQNLTANRALVSNSSGKVAVSAVTATELGYLDGVTSNIQPQLDAIKDGTTVVGRAANVTTQINGKAISDIFESDGTTVKNASEAETLTDPFTVGVDQASSVTGYVKFAEINLQANYRSLNARFEVLDKNSNNRQTVSCGIELTVYNAMSGNAPYIACRLLYGKSDYLKNIYVSYDNNLNLPLIISLYYNISGSGLSTIACIKPLFSYERSTLTDITFITDNQIIDALPTDTTNTLLSDIYTPVTEAFSAISDASGNNIPNTYAKKNGSYPTLGAGYLAKNLQFSVGTAEGAWYKVAEVDVSSVWANKANRSYSAFILLNTAHCTQNSGSSLGSGLIEFDVRKVTEDGVAKINEAETGTFLLAGNIQANRIATSISGFVVSLYVYFAYKHEAIDLTVVTESNEGIRCNYITLAQSNAGTSAPSGAVYAVNRNKPAMFRHVIAIALTGINIVDFDGSIVNSNFSGTIYLQLDSSSPNALSEDEIFAVLGQQDVLMTKINGVHGVGTACVSVPDLFPKTVSFKFISISTGAPTTLGYVCSGSTPTSITTEKVISI